MGQISKIILCLIGLLWLAGCSSMTGNWSWYGPSPVEQDYGNSVRNNYAQTVVNPGAGKDASPAVGMEPTAATNVLGNYEKGFKGEEKKGSEMKISY
jgi:hypothetical protein